MVNDREAGLGRRLISRWNISPGAVKGIVTTAADRVTGALPSNTTYSTPSTSPRSLLNWPIIKLQYRRCSGVGHCR